MPAVRTRLLGCIREDFGADGDCTPGFVRGAGPLKKKFCLACRTNGIIFEASRLRLMTSHVPRELLANSNGRSVWTKRQIGLGEVVQFRVISNSQKVAGQGAHPIILFQAPDAPLSWDPHWLVPIPAHFVSDGLVLLSVAHATLTLRNRGSKKKNVPLGTSAHEWQKESGSESLASTMSEHSMSPRSDSTPEGSISGLFLPPTLKSEQQPTWMRVLENHQHKLVLSQPQPKELPVASALYAWSSSPVVCTLVSEPVPMVVNQGMQGASEVASTATWMPLEQEMQTAIEISSTHTVSLLRLGVPELIDSTPAGMPPELGQESQTNPFLLIDPDLDALLHSLELPDKGLFDGVSPPTSPPERLPMTAPHSSLVSKKQDLRLSVLGWSTWAVRSVGGPGMVAYSFLLVQVAAAVMENYTLGLPLATNHPVDHTAMAHHMKQVAPFPLFCLMYLALIFLLGPRRDATPNRKLFVVCVLLTVLGPSSKLLSALTQIEFDDTTHEVITSLLLGTVRLIMNIIQFVRCFVAKRIDAWWMCKNCLTSYGASGIGAVVLLRLLSEGKAANYPPRGGSLEGGLLNGAALLIMARWCKPANRHRVAGWLSHRRVVGWVGSQAEVKTLPTHAARGHLEGTQMLATNSTRRRTASSHESMAARPFCVKGRVVDPFTVSSIPAAKTATLAPLVEGHVLDPWPALWCIACFEEPTSDRLVQNVCADSTARV